MSLRKTVIVLLVVTAALALVLIFTGAALGWVVIAYVLVVAGTLLGFLVGRLRTALPVAGSFDATLRRFGHTQSQPDPFEVFRVKLAAATGSQWSVHLRLRPIVQHIVSARLAYRHDIDLEREPHRAASLLKGTRTWELVRPDRRPPEDSAAPGWREAELTQLLDELERL